MSKEEDIYNYTPLPEPIPITEQEWPDDVVPLVHTRTMAYNHEKFIRECIEGLLMQKTTFPVQILIHDDASTDNTAEIIKEYEEKYPRLIKAYYQTENSYSKSSKEKGQLRKPFFKWITGKYVALCEGDDYWIDPLKLQKQVSFLEENPEYGLVHTDSHVYIQKFNKFIENINREFVNHLPVFIHNKNKLFCSIISSDYKVRTASVVFKNKLRRDLKFEPWFRMGDTPTWLQLSQITKFKYIDEPTVVYRVLSNSASKFTDRSEKLKFRMNGAEMRYYYLERYGYSLDKLRELYNTTLIELKSFTYEYPQRYPLINPSIIEKVKLYLLNYSIARRLFKMYYSIKDSLVGMKNNIK